MKQEENYKKYYVLVGEGQRFVFASQKEFKEFHVSENYQSYEVELLKVFQEKRNVLKFTKDDETLYCAKITSEIWIESTGNNIWNLKFGKHFLDQQYLLFEDVLKEEVPSYRHQARIKTLF